MLEICLFHTLVTRMWCQDTRAHFHSTCFHLQPWWPFKYLDVGCLYLFIYCVVLLSYFLIGCIICTRCWGSFVEVLKIANKTILGWSRGMGTFSLSWKVLCSNPPWKFLCPWKDCDTSQIRPYPKIIDQKSVIYASLINVPISFNGGGWGGLGWPFQLFSWFFRHIFFRSAWHAVAFWPTACW